MFIMSCILLERLVQKNMLKKINSILEENIKLVMKVNPYQRENIISLTVL